MVGGMADVGINTVTYIDENRTEQSPMGVPTELTFIVDPYRVHNHSQIMRLCIAG
jgi:hypothetical protein